MHLNSFSCNAGICQADTTVRQWLLNTGLIKYGGRLKALQLWNLGGEPALLTQLVCRCMCAIWSEVERGASKYWATSASSQWQDQSGWAR